MSSNEIREIGKTPPVPVIDGRGRQQPKRERREERPKKEEEAPPPEGKIDYRA